MGGQWRKSEWLRVLPSIKLPLVYRVWNGIVGAKAVEVTLKILMISKH